MPVYSETRDRILIFSGKHHCNATTVANSLRSQGHDITASDASLLVHLYEENEDRFFGQLNGWFSGIVIDVLKGRAFVFTDRYGVERLYYLETETGTYFSSEAKPLLRLFPRLREIDPKSLGEVFVCGCPLEDRSLFKDVRRMPAGSVWTLRGGHPPRKAMYFSPTEWEEQEPLCWEQFYPQIRETFVDCLPNYFRSNDSVALSVTAGLDTRMILACLNAPPGSLPCYTFGGFEDAAHETYDVRLGRRVARACGQTHAVVSLNDRFLLEFPQYAERTVYLSEGCHDAFGAHDLFFNELARDISSLRMSGKFGSEVVRMSRHLKASASPRELFDPGFVPYIEEAKHTIEDLASKNIVTFAAFVEIPCHEYGRLAIEKSQLVYGTPYMDNELVRLMYRGADALLNKDDVPIAMISECKPDLLRIMTDHGFPASRWPFVPRLTSSFYWKVLFKAEYLFKFRPARYDRIATVGESIGLDRLFSGRHILTDYSRWARGPLADYLHDTLLSADALSRSVFDKSRLRQAVGKQMAGQGGQLSAINRALTTELTYKVLLKNHVS